METPFNPLMHQLKQRKKILKEKCCATPTCTIVTGQLYSLIYDSILKITSLISTTTTALDHLKIHQLSLQCPFLSKTRTFPKSIFPK